ncbi:hypothetical protein AKJ36_02065, partial [candidate division MSBL1 archaeon SCGC-AAA259I07]
MLKDLAISVDPLFEPLEVLGARLFCDAPQRTGVQLVVKRNRLPGSAGPPTLAGAVPIFPIIPLKGRSPRWR